MQRFSPASLVKSIQTRFELTGGTCIKIDTRNRLSQTCPECFNRRKKELIERVHTCQNCGFTADRDMVSAFLAYTFDTEQNILCEERSKQLFVETGNAMLVSHSITNGIIKTPSPTKVVAC